MRRSRSILIVTADTIAGLGLRTLLVERFGVHATYLSSWEELALPETRQAGPLLAFCDPSALRAAPPRVVRALRDGIVVFGRGAHRIPFHAYVDIDLAFEALQETIAAVLPVAREEDPGKESTLSAREIEVLTLLARGHINKEIAARLSISVHTVISHRNNISAKLGIRTVPGLTVYATINGYISPDAIL